jgi:hypothetical protein
MKVFLIKELIHFCHDGIRTLKEILGTESEYKAVQNYQKEKCKYLGNR